MTIDELFAEWSKDSVIDRLDLAGAALDIPKLHNKYYRFYVNERLIAKKVETELNELLNTKRAWCAGELTREELQELNWQPQQKKFLKSEIDEFLRADKDVVKVRLRQSIQHEKTEALDSIIKMVSNRSFQISNAINFIKFQAGS